MGYFSYNPLFHQFCLKNRKIQNHLLKTIYNRVISLKNLPNKDLITIYNQGEEVPLLYYVITFAFLNAILDP